MGAGLALGRLDPPLNTTIRRAAQENWTKIPLRFLPTLPESLQPQKWGDWVIEGRDAQTIMLRQCFSSWIGEIYSAVSQLLRIQWRLVSGTRMDSFPTLLKIKFFLIVSFARWAFGDRMAGILMGRKVEAPFTLWSSSYLKQHRLSQQPLANIAGRNIL